jgi:tetratricopeptide (TPR) repeat protein
MAHWGIGYANGPHYNNLIVDEANNKAAYGALQTASTLAHRESDANRDLIAATMNRHELPAPKDRTGLERKYAAAMHEVWRAHPGDLDIGALYAEALMNQHPWDLWQADGAPKSAETRRIVDTLELVLKQAPSHPLALHLYIHAVEGSALPSQALDEADRLRSLQPGLPHMVHMPSHIDVRMGRWKEAALANERAIESDRQYRRIRPSPGFYRLYMLHDGHMLAFAAMMRGQSAKAIKAIDNMVAFMPADWVDANPALADGYFFMPYEVRIRFGKWDEILEMPEIPERFPISRALRHVARGVAYAAQGDTEAARREHKQFSEAKTAVPDEAFFGHNKGADLFRVGENMLLGEILYREGKHEEAFAYLRESVRCEDELKYDEPPDWIQPVRHALGAALLQSGRFAEAEQVYRDDLARLPHNGWSLFGLAQSLERQGKSSEAEPLRAELVNVWSDADIELSTSCLCLPGK